jgi:hypothetical protein
VELVEKEVKKVAVCTATFSQFKMSCPEKALQQNVTKDGKRRKRVR